MEQRDETETTREETPASIEQAKGIIEETTARVKESAAGLGQAAGEKLQEASQSLSVQLDLAKERTQQGMENLREDTERAVRRNPGPSLVAAVVLGFLIGSLIWR